MSLRALDANFNRAREALRVLEDVARFDLEDRELTSELKRLRHDLDALARPQALEFLSARAAASDVGRESDLPEPPDVVAANLKRAQEATRSLEEHARGRFPRICSGAHRVRFRLYDLESRLRGPRGRLRAARLCVLLDPAVARNDLERVAEEAIRGGADLLQLREKASDRALFLRARSLAAL